MQEVNTGSGENFVGQWFMHVKKSDNAASAQALFDQMFACGVSSKGEPIMKTCRDSGDCKPNPLFQIDPMDAIVILKDHLERSAESTKDNAAFNACLSRVRHLEQQLTTKNPADGSMHTLSVETLASLNRLIGDAHVALNANLLDDKTWGSGVPTQLVMRDMMGGLALTDIEDEERFMVRGKTYLKDSKKVPSDPPLFYLRGIQVVEQPPGSAATPFNVAEQAWCGFPKGYDQYNEWFIHNYIVPGSTIVNVVCFYTASRDALEVINSITMTEFAAIRAQCETDIYKATAPVHQDKAWANSVYRFWAGNDDYRNRTFKLYPRVNKASWAIQAAVGTKPALIGNNKLQLKYIRGANYLEVDIDMSSSTLATHILGMVRGVSKAMIVDLGVGIEGTREDELPEAILCQTRFDHVDLDGGVPIPAHLMTPLHTAAHTAQQTSAYAASHPAGSHGTGTVGCGTGIGASVSHSHLGSTGVTLLTPSEKIQRGQQEAAQHKALSERALPTPPPLSMSASSNRGVKATSPRKN